MLTDRDSLLRKLHELRSEHRDLDTVIARLSDQHGGTMSLQARLTSLKGRHADLETRIHDEDHRPRPDGSTLSRLKQQKLRLKEEIERVSRQA